MSKHHAQLYRNLASLSESGVDLRKSLKLSNSKPVGKLRKAMDTAADHVSSGGTIAEGLKKSKGIFSKLDIALIEAAETTGELPTSLRIMAKDHENRRKIIMENFGRFIYTIVIFHVAVLVSSFINTIQNNGGLIFTGFLPRFLIGLSFLYIPLISLILIITKTPETGPLRRIVDMIAWFIPGLGGGLRDLGLSRFSRVCNLAFKSGMAEDKSIELAITATGNQVLSDSFKPCIESVMNRRPISEGFTSALPVEFREIWAVGEMSGTMEDTTDKLANNYEDTGSFKMKAFCSIINWIFYITIVMYVAYTIVSMYAKVLGGMGI